MNGEFVIIARPHKQNPVQRHLYAGLTAFAWFAWIYLWLPIVTLVAWGAGLTMAHDRVFGDDPAHTLVDLRRLLTIAFACASTLFLWAAYNRWRFHHKDRRRQVRHATPGAISRHFHADALVSRRLRQSRRTVLHVDAAGRPLRAVIDPPRPPDAPVANKR